MLNDTRKMQDRVILDRVGGQDAVNFCDKYNITYASIKDLMVDGIEMDTIKHFLRLGIGMDYIILLVYTKRLSRLVGFMKYHKRVNNHGKLLLKRKKNGFK